MAVDALGQPNFSTLARGTVERRSVVLAYNLPDLHVLTRRELPADIQSTLLESTRSEWRNHPRFHGKASMLMGNHRKLLDGTVQLTGAIRQLLDIADSEVAEVMERSGILRFAEGLVSFAHHHHEIEDHGYFPQIEQMYPQLQRGLALLDGDHKVLDEALDGTQASLLTLKRTERATRDSLVNLLNGAETLEKILGRHIWDEEEIITPVFLRHG